MRNRQGFAAPHVLGAVVAVAILAACSGAGNGFSSAPPLDTSAARVAQRTSVSQNLYVANLHNITVYAPGANSPLRTISSGIDYPKALAFDKSGNLYATVGPDLTGCSTSVVVFASGGDKPLRTFAQKGQCVTSAVVDGAGNLYVSFDSKLIEYAAASGKVIWTLSYPEGAGIQALAFGSSLLYAVRMDFPSDAYAVAAFVPGSTKAQRTIATGSSASSRLSFAAGRLYALNGATQFAPGSVTIYPPGIRVVERKISTGVSNPVAFARDASGNLYVANCADCFTGGDKHGNISVYAPQSSKVSRTIWRGFTYPSALAFDSSGNLYVANNEYTRGSVAIYSAGASTPSRTIKTGVVLPRALAFGP
jgi:hypothetical protein